MFKQIETRVPISKIISAQIEEAILTKQFEPGSKIPSELELCEQFGASRTSVREALQILSAHNLITIIKGKGIFVNKISSESVISPLKKYLKLKLDRNYVLDLVHARQILEPAIASYAAMNRTEEDLVKLQSDLKLLEEYKGDYSELAVLDMKFHMHLAQASKNVVIPLLLNPIHSMLPEIKSTIYASVTDAKESAVIWHRKIYNEIEKGDPEAAHRAMLEHLKIAEEHAKKASYSEDESESPGD